MIRRKSEEPVERMQRSIPGEGSRQVQRPWRRRIDHKRLSVAGTGRAKGETRQKRLKTNWWGSVREYGFYFKCM